MMSEKNMTNENLRGITETKKFHEQQVLWPLTTGYTLLYLGLMVADFALRNAFTMPPGMMIVYIALLTAYAGDKEVRRWTGKVLPSRWGSVFIYLWFIFFAVAFTIQTFNPTFVLPADLSKICLQVLGIFFGSKISGKLYEAKASKSDEILSREQTLLALINEKGQVERKEIMAKLGLSDSTVGRLLDSMQAKGLITQVGQFKSTYYQLAKKTES